jgi:hypothetical protein
LNHDDPNISQRQSEALQENRTSGGPFSRTFKDLIDNQGEIALVIDFDERDNSACISSYSIHSQNPRLSEANIAGLYVSASTIPNISLSSQLAFLLHSKIHTTDMYSNMKASIVQPDNRDTDKEEDYDEGENEADVSWR